LEFKKFIQESEQSIDEASLKKKLFSMTYPNLSIPPLSQLLKEKKMNFSTFLNALHHKEGAVLSLVIQVETTLKEITSAAVDIL
jgi:hypothetical protein